MLSMHSLIHVFLPSLVIVDEGKVNKTMFNYDKNDKKSRFSASLNHPRDSAENSARSFFHGLRSFV